MFNEGRPIAACPGGAMLNSSISLGRAGVPVFLISEFARDRIGDIIYGSLMENNVSTEYIYRYEGKSPLALAFLDDRKNATYEFYEDFPQIRLHTGIPCFAPDDIVMFGSILSVTKEARNHLNKLISSAREAKSTILYDPNFRASQLPMLEQIKPLISENIAHSDIVRASDEDMRMIYECMNSEEAYRMIRGNGCNYLIYTASSDGVYLETPSFSKHYQVPAIQTVSTVGAGDSFNAGIAWTLHSKHINTLENISETVWDEIVGIGIEFASYVCMSDENYISNSFASGFKRMQGSILTIIHD